MSSDEQVWEAIINKMSAVKNTPFSKDLKDRKSDSAHASKNVFVHSWWTALYIKRWINEHSPWVEGLPPATVLACAFFHDISKAAECNQTCNPRSVESVKSTKPLCWYDAYSPKNYQGKGDGMHPLYAGEILLGKLPFQFCNDKGDIRLTQKLIDHLFSGEKVNIHVLALTAFMHWEIGTINQKLTHNPPYALKDLQPFFLYLEKFEQTCLLCNLKPSETLLKLCIAISFADIHASTFDGATCNTEQKILDRLCHPYLKDLKPYYPTYVPWVKFQMNVRANAIRNILIALFKTTEIT